MRWPLAVTLALGGVLSVSACGSASPVAGEASAGGGPAASSVEVGAEPSGDARDSTSSPAESSATEGSTTKGSTTEGSEAESPAPTGSPAGALNRTWTSHGGRVSFRYPSTWSVDDTQGAPKLSSPDGQVVGWLSPREDAEQVASPVAIPHPKRQDAAELSTELGRKVTVDSGHSPGQFPGGDTMVWQLHDTPPVPGGGIRTEQGGAVAFTLTQRIGDGNTAMTAEQAQRAVEDIAASENGRAAVAILRSLRIAESGQGA